MPRASKVQDKRTSATIKRGYIERVRDAMELVGDEVAEGIAGEDGMMTKEHYIEALEEIQGDVAGHLDHLVAPMVIESSGDGE